MGWLKKAARGFRKTAKNSFTVKGLVNNAKNLSGVGLLQRSKTARKVAFAGAAVVGAVYAAPYAASLGKAAIAGAGKVGGAALSGGGSLLKALYAPKMNGPGPAENPAPNDLASQMYAAESDPMLDAQMTNQRPLRNAAGFAGASAPASCASVGGSIDETGFYVTVVAYSLIALAAIGMKLWGKYGRHAKVTTD